MDYNEIVKISHFLSAIAGGFILLNHTFKFLPKLIENKYKFSFC